MPRPRYACLRRDKESGHTGVHFFGTFLHPRPEFYKYYFYLFTEDSPQEGRAFFNKDNRMCVAAYQKRCEEIKASGDLAYAYNRRHPRRGEATPFDEDHPKWENVEWAPPLEDDPDPPLKNGHR